ncbi:phosphate/phosphite/phosphonate ABC transporter substrate-binding protein [Lactobacillus sp. ESL0679]|uniref:phosphate/phosphite/phosphonate ABC transporter substrate-binding protein n=1 Tax=unclassified Lactobacillus TaxID=2620435 RepID=UPI0023F9871E|nr:MULTISPECIES: phosphate/phosphite/phosphonate ABC transporter substrate-binding protein [unclassified Lactobacillus]MDF7682322.1 phosphate/phosphite/phosphonate ABC transporter substrate-binding protein [Lactobacillus sp. ESL0679]WEV36879.1 phosphate/phosphite/phosphonate ABC transporter substrate-binding protein [Lactobacillus sp. ESL0677]
MKKFKKVLVGAVAVMGMFALTACSNKKETKSSNNMPKSLNVQFVPSDASGRMGGEGKPLEKMLSKRLGIPVHVTTSTDNNAEIEAMKSKKVDVGFLAAGAYVQAHQQKAADVILQSERYGIKEPGGTWTKKLVHTLRAEIVVRKKSNIKSWKDLKGKSISIQSPTSTLGYITPVAELKQKGLDVTKDCKLVTVNGHDAAVLNVLSGDTDAAFVFEDARNKVLHDVPNIKEKVVPIYFTTPIPNDTISVRPGIPQAFRKKLAKAFMDISKTKDGQKLIQKMYDQYGYHSAKDSDYNIVRKYNKIAQSLKK